jgi:hypothetical protein
MQPCMPDIYPCHFDLQTPERGTSILWGHVFITQKGFLSPENAYFYHFFDKTHLVNFFRPQIK